MRKMVRQAMIWRFWISPGTDRPARCDFPGKWATMTHRKAAQYLWRSAAVAAGGAILTIALAVALPLNLPAEVVDQLPTTLPTADKSAMGGIPSLSELVDVWSIDLGHN